MEEIIKHYEKCLEEYEGTCKEVDWPTEEGANARYRIMCEIAGHYWDIYDHKFLDYGCGTANLLNYIGWSSNYCGCDASPKMLEKAKERFPEGDFFHAPIHTPLKGTWDYILANGAYTEKRDYSWSSMRLYLVKELKNLLWCSTKGIAFNVMNAHSLPREIQREELFFVEFNQMAEILKEVGVTSYTFKVGYLPYEYTVYCYKE